MLSVIVAYVNEYPQLVFTIRAIAEELIGRVDFEIIAINNYCDEVKAQNREEDKGCSALEAAMEGNPWLRCLRYDTKLSHWQAKNLGIRASTGEFLWLPDAHVIPSRDSLYRMLTFYEKNWKELNGSIHLPITYQILESRRLIYELVADPEKGKYFYQFGCPILDKKEVFEVPVMSTCGCLMHRSIFDKLGGWPEEIGIYGGGEPFFNFTMAVMGMQKWIYPNDGAALHHHGAERGYNWNYDGWVRDELIAAYCYGGYDLMTHKAKYMDGLQPVISNIMGEILTHDSIRRHRNWIQSQQVTDIRSWVKPWLK